MTNKLYLDDQYLVFSKIRGACLRHGKTDAGGMRGHQWTRRRAAATGQGGGSAVDKLDAALQGAYLNFARILSSNV
jgi:hypothetical protein